MQKYKAPFYLNGILITILIISMYGALIGFPLLVMRILRDKKAIKTLESTLDTVSVKHQESLAHFESMMTPELTEYSNIIHEIEKAKAIKTTVEAEIISLKEQTKSILQEAEEKKKQIIILDDELLMQSFGVYQPMYRLTSSEEYKNRLSLITEKQKEMIRDKNAVNFYDGWTVNGSKAEGKKMTNSNIKQILRTFNNECDSIIDKVKFNNILSIEQRIRKAYDDLNKMNETNKISLKKGYLDLKIEELHLCHEYELKKQEEREEQQRAREELREEQKVLKEIEAMKKKIEKEEQHFTQAMDELKQKVENSSNDEEKEKLLDRIRELEKHMEEIQEQKRDVENREQNTRAGYVYIISNIGAFGEDVYKIGMTRRLEPLDRVRELGDASVPFTFDVHALIFSNDAPTLENTLHKHFDDKRLNRINGRKEFFKVTLDDIESIVKANHDKTVEFVKTPDAAEFRETIQMNKIA